MRVLALDFDGVISDSAREAFAVALRTYAELRPEGPLAALAGDPSPDRLPDLYRDFLRLMPLGNRAEDYAVSLSVCEQGAGVDDQESYDAFYRSLPEDLLARFHRRFYELRGAWSRDDREGWLSQMAPYPEVLEILERRAGDAVLAIATAKDRPSVLALLERYRIAHLFGAERILDKDAGVSKRNHLEGLAAALEVPLEEITFVDDKVNHLEDVAGLGVRCALAAWGYNGPRERERARRRGFLVCGIADLERQLFATL